MNSNEVKVGKTTIQVSVILHRELIQIKLDNNFNTLEEVINFLITKYNLHKI